jgi:two-component system, NtrC family, sensor kinase
VQEQIQTSHKLKLTENSTTDKGEKLANLEKLNRNTVWRRANQFFTLAPDLVGFISLEGEFQRVNPAFEKILSYTTEELLTRSFLDFVHPEDQILTIAEWEKLSAKTTSIHCENRYRCRDGSYKYLSWSIFGGVEVGLLYAIARVISTPPLNPILPAQLHPCTLEVDVGAALVGHCNLSESLDQCTEAMVRHLDALGAGIWTVASHSSLQLKLQAASGKLLPTESFPQLLPLNHELFSVIIQTRKPLSKQLLNQDCQIEHEECSFFSGYPLIIESRLVGVIALHSCQKFSEVVHNILGWVANAIAVAIDRDQVREELLSRREALLFGLANQIRNSLDLNTILDTAVQEIRHLLNIDGCHFLWCWLEGKQASLMVTHEACNPGTKSFLGECPTQYLPGLVKQIRKLEALRINDVSTANLDSEMQTFLGNDLNSGLLLPLKTKTGQLGAIVCSHYHVRVWSDQEVELLQAVVDQLAIAIEHAELFAKTRATALAAQTQARQLEFALQDLQQTESHLLQSEKMASLGQMVAGIAHEINNPVSFITGNLSHANTYIQELLKLVYHYQQYYPNPHPVLQEYIEEIDVEFLLEDLPKILASMQIGSDRIHEIVLSLKNFSRVDEAQMNPVNLHEGLDSTILILHNRLKPSGNNPGIMIVKEYGDLPLVECHYGQINQVFMNIISNAIDALENHPEPTKNITISTSVCQQNLEQDCFENTSTCQNSAPANSVIIRIRDNGIGMTPTVIEHLFDPFFTTKPVGKGTGLGLSISHQIIVEKHGGILKCLSEPEKGTEFWIQIPITPTI